MKMITTILFFIAALAVILFILNSRQKQKLPTGEGFIQVDGGKVWYQVSGIGDKTPMLLLHGGPGAPGYYLNPMKVLGIDRKLIFYHQLGCGKSDRIDDTSLMTVEHYVEELRTVIQHLGLKHFYLYGQSWGAMLGMDYYLKYPEGIRALIFSSPCLSTQLWLNDAEVLIAKLPVEIQQAIRMNEQNKSFDSPEYQQAVQLYYEQYVARKLPWSADIDSTFKQFGSNYQYMWGPSEFTVSGELASYDRTKQLADIKVPTLFVAGEFDEATPSTMEYYQRLVPGSKLEIIEGAAHLTMQDKPEQNNKVIADFLNTLELKRK